MSLVVTERLRVLLEQKVQKRIASAVNLVVSAREIASVPGVVNIYLFGQKVTEQKNFIRIVAARHSGKVGQIHTVHNQNIVGVLDVGKGNLPRPVRKAVTPLFKYLLHGRIDGVVLLAVGGPERIDLERLRNAALPDYARKDRLRHRRTADIAQTHESYGKQIIHPALSF